MTRNRAQQRRSVRLPGYDYASAGAYFVTMCARGRQLLFGEPQVRRLAETCWRDIPKHVDHVELDEWVVMPNHIHGIIVIGEREDSAEGRGVQLNAPTTMKSEGVVEQRGDANNAFSVMSPHRHTLSVIIRTYKAAVTTTCRDAKHAGFAWQRGYYEHVVRNERELDAIRLYIRHNPLKWALDRDNPANTRGMASPGSVNDYLRDLVA
jgi:putative transposase